MTPEELDKRKGPRLIICPLDLKEANTLVAKWHRHHKPTVGHKFSVGVFTVDGGYICGAAICGRPVARFLDSGWVLEVYRVVTDGTKNACSSLYGACRRIGFAMGYQRIITYTLSSESGGSLRASGWKCVGERGGGSWNTPSRPRVDKSPTCQKMLWEVAVSTSTAAPLGMKGGITENVANAREGNLGRSNDPRRTG